jgi:glycosyltransferase involved in cell wall biosynthesis
MNSDNPVVSIVIPAYNRVGPLRLTLASAENAANAITEPVEIVLVDDGSQPPLEDALADVIRSPRLRVLRQPNQGSIVARLAGLHTARGEFVLFLDSDDLVATAKLGRHIAALRSSEAAISYDDIGAVAQDRAGPDSISTQSHLANVATVEELLLRVQPPPHGPIYRRDYLLNALARPVVPPLRHCDAVGDIWLYYNLCVYPARIVKIDAPLTLIGLHDEARYSQHWERLGFTALEVMERFMQLCPKNTATERARHLVGECAFKSWRRLPRGFAPDMYRRLLSLWRTAPDPSHMRLGGPLFRVLSGLFGYIGAGRILRLRNASYASIRTIDDTELDRLRQLR